MAQRIRRVFRILAHRRLADRGPEALPDAVVAESEIERRIRRMKD